MKTLLYDIDMDLGGRTWEEATEPGAAKFPMIEQAMISAVKTATLNRPRWIPQKVWAKVLRRELPKMVKGAEDKYSGFVIRGLGDYNDIINELSGVNESIKYYKYIQDATTDEIIDEITGHTIAIELGYMGDVGYGNWDDLKFYLSSRGLGAWWDVIRRKVTSGLNRAKRYATRAVRTARKYARRSRTAITRRARYAARRISSGARYVANKVVQGARWVASQLHMLVNKAREAIRKILTASSRIRKAKRRVKALKSIIRERKAELGMLGNLGQVERKLKASAIARRRPELVKVERRNKNAGKRVDATERKYGWIFRLMPQIKETAKEGARQIRRKANKQVSRYRRRARRRIRTRGLGGVDDIVMAELGILPAITLAAAIGIAVKVSIIILAIIGVIKTLEGSRAVEPPSEEEYEEEVPEEEVPEEEIPEEEYEEEVPEEEYEEEIPEEEYEEEEEVPEEEAEEEAEETEE